MFTKSFDGIKPFNKKVWLASPTMHEEELEWIAKAINDNWVTTAGENIDNLEKACAEHIGRIYSVGLSSGTASLHLAIKICGEKLYGQPKVGHGTLEGGKVMTI